MPPTTIGGLFLVPLPDVNYQISCTVRCRTGRHCALGKADLDQTGAEGDCGQVADAGAVGRGRQADP